MPFLPHNLINRIVFMRGVRARALDCGPFIAKYPYAHQSCSRARSSRLPVWLPIWLNDRLITRVHFASFSQFIISCYPFRVKSTGRTKIEPKDDDHDGKKRMQQ